MATATARLDATFFALADPTRRAILSRLAIGDASVTELAQPFAMSQPAISKHIKVLEKAGLVTRGPGSISSSAAGPNSHRRSCRIVAKPLGEATAFLEDYRRFWEKSFERLDALLGDLQRKPRR